MLLHMVKRLCQSVEDPDHLSLCRYHGAMKILIWNRKSEYSSLGFTSQSVWPTWQTSGQWETLFLKWLETEEWCLSLSSGPHMWVSTYVCTYIHPHTHVHLHTHTHVPAHTGACTHTHIYLCAYTQRNTHIHTRNKTWQKWDKKFMLELPEVLLTLNLDLIALFGAFDL